MCCATISKHVSPEEMAALAIPQELIDKCIDAYRRRLHQEKEERIAEQRERLNGAHISLL